MALDFANKAGILGQLWIEFRGDEDFTDFIEYNDLGLPMSYMVAEGLIKECSVTGEALIEETFNMFCELLEITDEDFDILDEINLGSVLMFAYNKKQNKPE
jgi:hypothetical protein